jgi:hypothetical protein
VSRRTLVSGTRAYTVAIEDPPPVAERWSALAVGQMMDEETERAPAVPVVGRTDRAGVTVAARGDGTFALVARPWLACPPLLAPSYTLTATIEAEGYLPVDLSVVVPSQQRTLVAPGPAVGNPIIALNTVAGLLPGQLLAIGPPSTEERARIHHPGPGPQQVTLTGGLALPHAIGDHVVADAWTPVALGVVGLRREPVVVRGRTMRRDAATNTVTPVPLATVTLTDFWTTLSAVRSALPGSMTDPSPATRAFLASVSPGLVTDRGVGAGQVNRQDLVAVVADERFLVDAAGAGATTIRVTSRQALAAGTELRLEPDDPEIGESIRVAAVSGLGPPDQPGDVTLALPLRSSHHAGRRLRRVLPQPPGPLVALRRDARRLDRTLFFADATSLPDDVDVRLTGGTPSAERQHARRLEVTSDANGYFTLPPVHRVAALQFHVTAPLLTPVDVTYHPQYGQPENWLDIVFA